MRATYEIDHTVYRTSLEEEMKFLPTEGGLKFIISVSGCFVCQITPEQAVVFNNERSTDIYRPGPAIVIIDEFVSSLSQEEATALYYHELGHIRLGHLNKVKSGSGVVVNSEWELEADAFAVNLVGKEAVKNSVEKILTHSSKFATKFLQDKGKDVSEEEVLTEILSNTVIQARFSALN
ncbi:hypothetical protein [Flavobacterium sp.]|jgi:Zn-dependent protease with chaperone function|uniref:hypothetical protein n=1 Tax=Flavobacterium sp. TaxID=239 RepID=UPI0037C0502C